MDLKQELEAYQLKSMASKSEEDKNIMLNATKRLQQESIAKNSLKVGDYIPTFTLPNALGKLVDVHKLLVKGPLVITFYRGAWCPYCNIQLRAYQKIVPELQKAGATLVAISPEKSDLSLSLKEKRGLEFEVLSDKNHHVARQFGIVFKLEKSLLDLYLKMGINLELSQGNQEGELPLPATYVVNQQGKIVYAFVNEDYTKRLEPTIALEEVLKLVK